MAFGRGSIAEMFGLDQEGEGGEACALLPTDEQSVVVLVRVIEYRTRSGRVSSNFPSP